MSDANQARDVAAVELSNIDFSYAADGESLLLSGVTVRFPIEETIAVMGRSGCGKTTLLNLIAGLERPKRGTIRHYCPDSEAGSVDFSCIQDKKLVDFRRRNIGFVFQRFNLLADLTVFQNVMLAARVAGMKSSDSTTATFDALRSVELSGLESRLPNSLSGGEAQRVGIARAIVKRPRLLLADEPTGNLDSQTTSMVISSLIFAAQQIRGTLVIVTHDRSVASAFNMVYKLDGGRMSRCSKDQLL
jgi:ABC-type lipoprotein export system ATPase subunit